MPRGGNQSTAHTALISAIRDYSAVCCRGYYIKLVSQGFQRAGLPDAIAIIPDPAGGIARAVCLEAKSGNARLTFPQEVERMRIQQAGGLYIVVREPEDLDRAFVDAGLVAAPLLGPVGRARGP